MVNGKIVQSFELKQLTTGNLSNIAKRIKDALIRQGNLNAILDLRRSPLSNKEVIMGVEEAIRKGFVGQGQTIRAITKHGLDRTWSF